MQSAQKQRLTGQSGTSWVGVWGSLGILDEPSNVMPVLRDPQTRPPQSQYPKQTHRGWFIDYKLKLGPLSSTLTPWVEEKGPELLGLGVFKKKNCKQGGIIPGVSGLGEGV